MLGVKGLEIVEGLDSQGREDGLTLGSEPLPADARPVLGKAAMVDGVEHEVTNPLVPYPSLKLSAVVIERV